jgi:uncharacterized membrane protein YeaQ/YmgE (transglycosylase-associated protein family)
MKTPKKLLQFLSFIIVFTMLVAAVPISTETKTVPSIETATTTSEKFELKSVTVKDFISFNTKDYKKLTGKKLSFKEKMGMKLMQKDLARKVRANKLDENAKLDFAQTMAEGERSFNIGGFLLGLLLGLIGVALAHIFSRDRAFRRSSWQGVGVLIVIALIGALI